MSEIDEEFRHHIERATADLIQEGMTPEDARREAQRRFGSISHYRTQCESAKPSGRRFRRRSAVLTTLLQDVRYSLRSFRRHPRFLLATSLTLAVGIGASTVIFSVVDTVLLRPLPYLDADRLVQVGTMYGGRDRLSSSSPRNFFDWRDRNDVFDLLVASRLQTLTLTGQDLPERIMGAGVSAGFFELLGHSPVLGRGILSSDDNAAGNRVLVISHGTWQSRWGGAPDVLGRRVRMSGEEFEIVGVMAPSFRPPEAIYHQDVEVWFPLAFVSDDLDMRDNGILQVVGRLKRDRSIEQARLSLGALQRNIYAEHGTDDPRLARFREGQTVGVEWMHEQTVGAARSNLLIFLGAVGFLLLIACANVANLFLVRAIGRDREIALRAAMGAGEVRIVRQMLTEGVVTAVIGGAAGVGIAVLGVRLFRSLAPEGIPRVAEVAVDLRVLGFAFLVSVITGVLFGAAPALRHRRTDINEALKDGSATASPNRQHNLVRHGLIVFETAIALMLLVGAGLLMNSFVRRANADPGFDVNGVVRMALFLENRETADERAAFFDQLVAQVRAIPGVTEAAATNNLPMTRNRSTSGVTIDGRASLDTDPSAVLVNSVTDGFFETMRIPIVAGRALERVDGMGEPVAVVNTTMADAFWDQGAAIGGRFKFGDAEADGPWYTVVGVAREIDQLGLGEAAGPALYLSHAAAPFVFGNVVARTEGDVSALVPAMRRALASLEPNMPVEDAGPLADQMRATVTEPRFYSWLFGSFAIVALCLATVGIFGTVSYSVSSRTHEIGIRLAMGAGRRDVRLLIMKQGMIIAAVGLGIGMVGAVGFSGVLRGLVFDIQPIDLPTIGAVTVLLAGVAAVATWLPARRATLVEPMETLRAE